MTILFIGGISYYKGAIGIIFMALSVLLIYNRYTRNKYDSPDATYVDWVC
jgi:hypothetical protein